MYNRNKFTHCTTAMGFYLLFSITLIGLFLVGSDLPITNAGHPLLAQETQPEPNAYEDFEVTDAEIQEMQDRVQPRLEAAQEKAAFLEKKIEEVKSNGHNVRPEQVSLNVAKFFLKAVQEDMINVRENAKKTKTWRWGVKTNNYSDGKALKYMFELPEREINRVHNILNRTLDRVRNYDFSERPEDFFLPDIKTLQTKGRYIHLEGRPYFLHGYNGVYNFNQASYVKKFGSQIVMNRSTLGGLYPDGPELNENYAKKKADRVRQAWNRNLLPIIRMKFNKKKWISEKYPDIHDAYGHFMKYDIDHPATNELRQMLIDGTMKYLPEEQPFWVKLGNELSFRIEVGGYSGDDHKVEHSSWSDYTVEKFVQYLKKKYSDLASVNNAWGTEYTTFEEAANHPLSPDNPAHYYDACKFNSIRVLDFYRKMHEQVKANNTRVPTYVNLAINKMIQGSRAVATHKHGVELNRTDYSSGVDFEGFANTMDIKGFDTRSMRRIPINNFHPWYKIGKYASEWLGIGMGYRLKRSFSRKPMLESELHNIQTVATRVEEQPPGQMSGLIWLMHLQGVSASQLWFWGRRDYQLSNGYSAHYASPTTMPHIIDAYARSVAEINMYADFFTSLNRESDEIYILYSPRSAIQDVNYMDRQMAAYEALAFSGKQISFVTEKTLQEGDLDDCKLLVIPQVNHVSRQTIDIVRNFYRDHPQRVVIVGDSAFKYNSLEKNHDPNQRKYVDNIPNIEAAESNVLYERLHPYIENARIDRPITCVNPNNNSPVGIFYRYQKDEDGDYRVAVINLLSKQVDVELRLEGDRVNNAYNLISCNMDDISNLTLNSQEVRFYKITKTFSRSKKIILPGETVDFSSLSSNADGNVTSWSWNFGDGTTSNAENPTHTFASPGTYTITLTMTYEDGSTVTYSQEITVREADVVFMDNFEDDTLTDQWNVTYLGGTSGVDTRTAGSGSHAMYTGEGNVKVTTTSINLSSYEEGSVDAWIRRGSDSFSEYPEYNDDVQVEYLGSSGRWRILKTYFGGETAGQIYTPSFDLPSDAFHTDFKLRIHQLGGSGTGWDYWHVDDVVIKAAPSRSEVIGETGTLTVNKDGWSTHHLRSNYRDPIVIMKPLSYNGFNPAHIRLRNVQSDSFEYTIEEWKYLDGKHVPETVSFIVLEKGSHVLPNGLRLEVGTRITNQVVGDGWDKIAYANSFSSSPIVLAQSQTRNGGDPIVVRVRNVDADSFQIAMQEEQALGRHMKETLGYIAISRGTTSFELTIAEAGETPNAVTDHWYRVTFHQGFGTNPVFLANQQTTDGNNTAGLRFKNLSSTGVDIKVEEEQSANLETNHTTESVGYFVLESGVLIKK